MCVLPWGQCKQWRVGPLSPAALLVRPQWQALTGCVFSERAPCVPSRVLHLRQLPFDITEQEVLALALPFGRVNKLITLKAKNQVTRSGE